MILALQTLCILALLFASLAYRIERDHRTDRLNELEHRLNDALSRNYQLEREAKHWHIIANECRQTRFRLLEELSEARKKLAEKS